MLICSVARADLLSTNRANGDRHYDISTGIEYITAPLTTTGYGVFDVSGTSTDSVLSGFINGDVNNRGSFFKLNSPTKTVLNLSNLTIQDAFLSNGGGSVIQIGKGNEANLYNVIIKDNGTAGRSGGAISSDGKLTIRDSQFINNTTGTQTTGTGGAINVRADADDTIIDNSLFEGNSSYRAGTIGLQNSNLTVTNSIFRNNRSTNTTSGGNTAGIYLGAGNTVNHISNCLFDSNVSGFNAGAIYSYGNTTIENTRFTNNSAGFRGGAIVNGNNSTLNLTASLFDGNTSQESGGALYNDATVNTYNTIFHNNKALHHETSGTDGKGGAIYNSGRGILDLNSGTIFSQNSAAGEGGAIANTSALGVNIAGATFIENHSDVEGGAIWNSSQIDIKGGTSFLNNSADGYGGAISNRRTLNLTSDENGDIVFSGNSAGVAGNDIYTLSTMNIDGDSGTVLLSGGVAGRGAINKTNNGAVIFQGNNSEYTGTYNQTDGTTAVSNGTFFTGASTINGGTLQWGENFKKIGGTLKVNSGTLALMPNAVLDLSNPADLVLGETIIYLAPTSTLNNGATVTLNKGDIWQGAINNSGTLTVDDVRSEGSFSQSSGDLYMHNNSELFTGQNGQISGGNMTIDSGSVLNVGDLSFNVDNLYMDNARINSLNFTPTHNTIGDVFEIGSGGARFGVDFDADRRLSDSFTVNGQYRGPGTITIDDYNVIGVPYDVRIPFDVFNGTGVDKINFGATDKEVMTPLYSYKLASEGSGNYSLLRGQLNQDLYRGAQTVEATFLNNINVINMLFKHVYIDSQKFGKKEDKTHYYAPFQQYENEEGSPWFKPFVLYDKMSLRNNNTVYNTAYGNIIGYDFPTRKLKKSWKFLPTTFITYQGAHQGFNGNDYYQNGGMGGFMGTFFRDDFISSVLAYGGGYGNRMQGERFSSEDTGNWHAGAAAIAAYNFHPKKNVIIQPIVWSAYNVLGRQHWNNDFGNISMRTGYLNGIAVSPGVNVFAGNEKGSVFASISYVFTINDHTTNTAGPITLDSTRLRYGFLQYGIGFVKTFKDRLQAYGQISLMQGGLTGVMFWCGLSWQF